MENLKNFEEVKNEIAKTYPGCDKNLLLANGFTIACVDTIDEGLGEKINAGILIKSIHDGIKNDIKNINNVEDYIQEVEKKTIKAIYDSLPDKKINRLEDRDQIISFLKYFGKYYTLNYDYVLYKLLLRVNDIWEEETNQKHTLKDGFYSRYNDEDLIWKENTNQNIFYLHGAFHFIKKENDEIKKVKRNETEDLYTKILEEWNKDRNSHVILSSDYQTKKLKMTNKEYSEYFYHCFDSFKNMSGILVTMGVSFGESDTHIVEAIKENGNLKKIYLGWRYESDLEHYKEIFKEIPEDKISYYPTENIFKD